MLVSNGAHSFLSWMTRAEGYRLTMHCDVDQADAVGHIWQALDDIGVERIDQGADTDQYVPRPTAVIGQLVPGACRITLM